MGKIKELLVEANDMFGSQVVSETMMVVQVADPDGAYSHFEDMGMFEHAECVEFLYFDNHIDEE